MGIQTQALAVLLDRSQDHDPLLGGTDQGADALHSSSSVRGAAGFDRMRTIRQSRPGYFSQRVMANMLREMDPVGTLSPEAAANPIVPDALAYLERFGNFGGDSRNRTLGLVSWAVSHALNQAWRGQAESSADTLALLLTALEQVTLDHGDWGVGWMYTLLPEPPQVMMGRAPERGLMRSFPRLADQTWTTTSLAYLRELDTIQTRRRELQTVPPRKPGPPGREGEETPPAKPKPPKKPKAPKAEPK